jgi:hypothetical protein
MAPAVIPEHPEPSLDECGNLAVPHGDIGGKGVGEHHDYSLLGSVNPVVEGRCIQVGSGHALLDPLFVFLK